MRETKRVCNHPQCPLCVQRIAELEAQLKQEKPVAEPQVDTSYTGQIAALREQVGHWTGQAADYYKELHALREQLEKYVLQDSAWVAYDIRVQSELQDAHQQIARLGGQLARMPVCVEALQKLARLGNEPHYGNSRGNDIAIKALQDIGVIDPPEEPKG